MKNTPHLIWAVTTLLVVGMIIFFVGKVLKESGAQKAALIETLHEVLERKDGVVIRIEIGGGEPKVSVTGSGGH